MKIPIDEIKQLCEKILVKKGLSKEDSEVVIEEYLHRELSGKTSHGFASFLDFASKGIKINKPKWKIQKEEDNYALIDANGNLGQIVGKHAMEMAIEKAKAKGIALVGMNNMKTYLTPGYYAQMASDENMIGIVINNSKSRVAPFGGIEPKLGTNPISIAIPTKETSFVLDMATSTKAMAEVRLAKKLDGLLPEGMAIDEKGNPTNDPNKVNALIPFGNYKGYGLCLAIEILAGSFVRAKMGEKLKDGLDRGYLFLVINPEIFVDINSFKDEIQELIKSIKSSKKAEGVQEILIPGENAAKTSKENLDKGYLEFDNRIIEGLKQLF